MPIVPQFQHPFSVVEGQEALVEQDSPEDIVQCVEACARTLIGSRVDAPAYGIPDETFAQLGAESGVEAYVQAIEEAEPRARLLSEERIEGIVKRVILKVENE